MKYLFRFWPAALGVVAAALSLSAVLYVAKQDDEVWASWCNRQSGYVVYRAHMAYYCVVWSKHLVIQK